MGIPLMAKKPEDVATIDVVQMLIDMNMKGTVPTLNTLEFMLEAARMDHRTLGNLARRRINKMTDDEIGEWFKFRVRACITRYGTRKHKNKIRGIAKEQGWLK